MTEEVYNPMQPWDVHQRVPEQELFKAVIATVIESACSSEDSLERKEDRAYLCARTRRDKKDLQEICGWAGVSYDKVVETARKWEAENSWPSLKTIKHLLRAYQNSEGETDNEE